MYRKPTTDLFLQKEGNNNSKNSIKLDNLAPFFFGSAFVVLIILVSTTIYTAL